MILIIFSLIYGSVSTVTGETVLHCATLRKFLKFLELRSLLQNTANFTPLDIAHAASRTKQPSCVRARRSVPVHAVGAPRGLAPHAGCTRPVAAAPPGFGDTAVPQSPASSANSRASLKCTKSIEKSRGVAWTDDSILGNREAVLGSLGATTCPCSLPGTQGFHVATRQLPLGLTFRRGPPTVLGEPVQ